MDFSSIWQKAANTIAGTSGNVLQQQNYWNDPIAETFAKNISSIEVLQTANRKVEEAPVEGKHFNLRFPANTPWRITSPYGPRTLTIDGKKVKQTHIGIDVNGARDLFTPEDVIIKKILPLDVKYPNRFIKDPKKGYLDGIKAGKIPAGRAWTPYIIAMGIHTKTLYKFKHCVVKGKKYDVGSELYCDTLFCVSGDFGYSLGPHLHFETYQFNPVVTLSKIDGTKTNWPKPMDPLLYYQEYGMRVH